MQVHFLKQSSLHVLLFSFGGNGISIFLVRVDIVVKDNTTF